MTDDRDEAAAGRRRTTAAVPPPLLVGAVRAQPDRRSPAPRAATSGTTTASATSTSPRSSSTSRSATSTRRSSRRSRSRPRSSARSGRRWRPTRARELGAAARRGDAGRPDHVVLHERRRRGERERDQARALVHRPAQDHRALPLATTARPPARSRSPATRAAGPPSPGIPGVVRMLDPYTYRCPAGHPDPCPVCTGAPHLEEILQYEGAHTVAAVILETVVGTNGIIVPPDGYLQSIREVCDRHGILLIADEVMAGFGRTGKWFACRALGRRPGHHHDREGDQLRLRPARRDDRRASRSPTRVADKFFAGGLTYSGHPLACASAVASIEAFQEEGIVENAAAMGDVSRARSCRSSPSEHPSIGEVRGLGLFWGLELVQEPRDARAARPVQRRRRGGRAGRAADEGGARARPLPVRRTGTWSWSARR